MLLALGGVVMLRPLTVTWDDNPNYSFGWYIPLVAAFLFYERWPTRPARMAVGTRRFAFALVGGGVAFLAFRLAAEADPDWRPGLWVLMGLYVAVLAGWLWLYGGRAWLKYFAFPIGFLLLSLPWFFEIEYPLTQGLMRWNASLVAASLREIAIAAEPAGNIIQLQTCQLGVEEACSGILSLQASLMMGVLLGEIYRLSLRRRVGLVFTSMALALIGNYGRTFFLALMAFYGGASAVPEWHDVAGYSILVFTAVGSWLAALALTQGMSSGPATAAVEADFRPADEPRQAQLAQRLAVAVLIVALLGEAATQAWFGWKETTLSRHPGWTVQLDAAPAYRELKLSDITLQALRADEVKAGTWQDSRGWDWTAYWMRYEPKPYTRVVLGWHNPDNCLPSVGLEKDQDYPDFVTSVNGVDLRVAPKRFRDKDKSIYVFWVVYPRRGDLPPREDTRIELPFWTKFQMHFDALEKGSRGVGVETMEMVLQGPASYEEAREAYLTALKAMVTAEGGLPTPSQMR